MKTKAEEAIQSLLDWINSRGEYEDYPLEEVMLKYSSAQSAIFSLIPLEIAKALDEGYPEDNQ